MLGTILDIVMMGVTVIVMGVTVILFVMFLRGTYLLFAPRKKDGRFSSGYRDNKTWLENLKQRCKGVLYMLPFMLILHLIDSKDEETLTSCGDKRIITASSLNVRSAPNLSSDKVYGFKKNAKVCVIDSQNGWVKTEKGWILELYTERIETGANKGAEKEVKPEVEPINTTEDSEN